MANLGQAGPFSPFALRKPERVQLRRQHNDGHGGDTGRTRCQEQAGACAGRPVSGTPSSNMFHHRSARAEAP